MPPMGGLRPVDLIEPVGVRDEVHLEKATQNSSTVPGLVLHTSITFGH